MHGGEHQGMLAHAEIIVRAPYGNLAGAVLGVADGAREIALLALKLGENPVASFLVKAGDVVAVREKAKKQLRVTDSLKLAESIGMPAWVSVDATKLEGTFKKTPDRDEFGAEINESMIVELYSR